MASCLYAREFDYKPAVRARAIDHIRIPGEYNHYGLTGGPSRFVGFDEWSSLSWLRFVYTHFKSCDQSLDKTIFDFSNIFHAMQSCAINAKSSTILKKLPMGMVT